MCCEIGTIYDIAAGTNQALFLIPWIKHLILDYYHLMYVVIPHCGNMRSRLGTELEQFVAPARLNDSALT